MELSINTKESIIMATILSAHAPLIFAFFYVGPAYALYKMAKDLDIKGAWLAWVPFANVYPLGAVADHQMKRNNGKDHKLRKLLSIAQIGVVGLPVAFNVVSLVLQFLLGALADLVLVPASVSITFLSLFLPEIGGMLEGGADWSSILALLEQYLPILFGIILGFNLLNLAVKLLWGLISLLLNIALSLLSFVVSWAVVIMKYIAFFKVYELYAPKFALPLLAITLGLDLAWSTGYQLFFPTVMLILAHRKPVYKDAAEAASPAEEDFAIPELSSASPVPAPSLG